MPNAAHELKARARSRADQPRVLVLGDSFSVEDPAKGSKTLGNQLRSWFTQRGAAIVNLSRSGFSPQDSLSALDYFQVYGPDYHPDLVMFDYYVGNDLTDEKWAPGPRPLAVLPMRGGAFLEHFYLVRLLRDLKRERELQHAIADAERQVQVMTASPDARAAARQAASNPFLVTELQADPGLLAHNLLVDEPADLAAWEDCKRVLRAVKAYADREHARMVINVFPHTLQVNDSHYQFYAELGLVMDRRYLSSTVPQDLLKRFCAGEGIVCNDLLPTFKEHPEPAYMEHDDHWIQRGHTIAAQEIEAFVEAQHLLPSR